MIFSVKASESFRSAAETLRHVKKHAILKIDDGLQVTFIYWIIPLD